MEDRMKLFAPQDPIPARIVMPAEVAFDIGSLHTTIDNLARKLGCEACFSGHSCVFTLERDFVVNPRNFEVQARFEGHF
jgi:hypothetical protein